MGEVRALEEKTKKAEKFEERFEETTDQMIETTQQCEELKELEDKNHWWAQWRNRIAY